jgi:hypothetical protein
MLPASFPVLFGDFEASMSLPRGILSIVILVVALVVPLFLFFGKKNGPGGVSSRNRDVVLIMGECKSGKTVLFHQVRRLALVFLHLVNSFRASVRCCVHLLSFRSLCRFPPLLSSWPALFQSPSPPWLQKKSLQSCLWTRMT